MSHIHLSPLDHLRLFLSQLPSPCPCLPPLPCFRPPPPSPPLSPQEGELENLLAEPASWDSDEDVDGDGLMLRTPRGVKSHGMRLSGRRGDTHAASSGTGSGSGSGSGPGRGRGDRLDDPPSYEYTTSLFPPSSTHTPTFNRPRNPSRRSTSSAYTHTYATDADPDAVPLQPSTLAHLPELAKRFDPTLTLEDLAREEAEEAERERRAERAGGLDMYSPQVGAGVGTAAGAEADEFGEFEQAQVGVALGIKDDEEGEEMAEVSFGLGEEDAESSDDEGGTA